MVRRRRVIRCDPLFLYPPTDTRIFLPPLGRPYELTVSGVVLVLSINITDQNEHFHRVQIY